MRDLGVVRPGQTIYIPFDTFGGGTGASITMTGLAVTDIEIYKNGSTTQRASDTGYTLLDTDGIDFDSITGIHGFSINLASNATAGFFTAGARYFVVISSITVDGQTVNFVAATFYIGYPGAILDTTIATLASQVSFTLTAGSADNNAYIGCPVVIHDIASAIQVAIGYISAYTGSTRTVALAADPAIFTMAAGDNVSVFLPANMRAIAGSITNATNIGTAGSNYSATRGLAGTALPAAAADAAGGLPISDAGGLDLDAILADTNTLNDTKVPDTLSLANINAQVDTALTDIHLDHLLAADYDPASKPGTSTALLNELVEDDSGVSRFTVNALENAPSGSGASAETIADAVLDEALSGHTTAGTLGKALADIEADTNELQGDWANGGRLDLLIDAIKAVTDNLPDSGALTSLATAASIAALNDPTPQEVVDELMAEVLESGKTYKQALLDLWAVIVGNSAADDADNPTSITYDSPDDSVQRTHALTSTTRTQS